MFPMHTVQTILEILPVLGRHNFQHHTGEKRLDPRQQNESAGDQRRESRHQSRIQILQKYRNKQYHRHRCQQKCQHAEEMHGFIVFIQLQHLADHAETVTVSIQLGLAALGTVTIFHHHILYLHVIVHRMDRHLRLDLKSFGEYRECLHEFITERAITGHDVLDIGMKQAVDPRTHQTVAEIMKRPLIFRKISRRQAVSHHHIRLMLQNLCHHLPGTIQRIRVVSVDHKIAFRIDLTKHSADHVSLSLGIFMTYDRSRFRCQFHGTVGGIIAPEQALKLFIRFALAKAAVTYGLDLMLAIFQIVQGMVSTVINQSGVLGMSAVTLPQELIDAINEVGFWDSIPLWAVTLIGGLLITVLSFVMILTVYGRMFSLWMYAAIAPVPLSSFAGEPTSNVGKNFLRSYAGVCLQGVVIALACIIFSAVSSSPPAVDTSVSVVAAVWTYVGELAFNLLVLVGAVKGCDRIVKEIMGL